VETNLSGYAISPKGSADFVALDAGSLLGGLIQVEQESGLDVKESKFIPAATMLKEGIKAYLITHPHLDHCAGLVINSTADTKKPILATGFTIDAMRDHLFNWKIWPNFGSEGKKPRLNIYAYQRLKEGKQVAIPKTAMRVEAFLLSHPGDYLSTAFLLESNGVYLLYVGDTAPDVLSPKKRLAKVWERIAPLIRHRKLAAIFIESSCIDSNEECALYGHLTPQFLMQEMHHLASLVDPGKASTSLSGLKVVVTHIKETLLRGPSAKEIIEQELTRQNDLGISFLFPSQGQKLLL
jgi:3',5'-cyclic-nucleotide phosphodiesterase